MVEIKELFPPICKARSGMKRKGFVGVTIHNTDNYSKNAGALSHAKYLQNSGQNKELSWHYVVDDSLITHVIPDDEVAWHAGDGHGDGNMKTIAIEICVNPESNLEKATDNAAELTAKLLLDNGLKSADGWVWQHNHWSGKNCPREIRQFNNPCTWIDFLNTVNSYLNKYNKSEEERRLIYSKFSDLPTWGRGVVAKLIDNNIILGDEKGNINLSEDMLRILVIIDRAGLFKTK